MAEGKIVPGEESFNQDSIDDEITNDDVLSSESEVSEDSSVTGESSDEDLFLKEATVAVGKMHLVESFVEAIEHIEKQMEELEVRRTEVACPVAQRIIDGHKNMLLKFREVMQKRLEEMKLRLHPVQESLKEDIQTLTDLKIEKSTDEKNDNLIAKHGDLQVEESLKEDIQTLTDLKIEKSTDEKNDNLIAEHGDLQVEETTDEKSKKGEVGDGDADLKGGKEATADCDIKSYPGNEEKRVN